MTTKQFDDLDPEIKEIIGEIVFELNKAMVKHSHWPINDSIHAAAIVGEESGELIRACLQFEYEHGNYTDAKKEAVQTGAMAIRFLLNR